jgi:hypothetical protein
LLVEGAESRLGASAEGGTLVTPSARLVSFAAAAVLTLVGGAATAADTAAPHAENPREVAGVSPFTGVTCNVPPSALGQVTVDREVEPILASDPRNRERLVGAWIDLTGATIRTAATGNGGRTWTLATPPGLDGCTGASGSTAEGTYDPWVSIGADGVAYLASVTLYHFYLPPFSAFASPLNVQRSLDGGASWSDPVLVPGADAADNPMIVADPYRAARVYVVYRNDPFGLTPDPEDSAFYVARSDDHGQTWTPASIVARPPDGGKIVHPAVSVLADGVLVATYGVIDPSASVWTIESQRSSDNGLTWSPPTLIRTTEPQGEPAACGIAFDRRNYPSQQAVMSGRRIAIVSADAAASNAGHGKIVLSESGDDGATWSNTAVVTTDAMITQATVAADRHGRLGLLWDEVDVAHADCGAGSVPMTTRVATIGRGGRLATAQIGTTWDARTTLVGPPYDSPRWWLGEYQGLAGLDHGTAALTVQARPALGAGDTGVFFAHTFIENGAHSGGD